MLSLVADTAPSWNTTILLCMGVAWGIATSPLPLAALVAILLTPKPARAALAFTITWFIAMFASLYAFSFLGERLSQLQPTQQEMKTAYWTVVALGVILLVVGAILSYRGRNKDKTATQERTRRMLEDAGASGPRRAVLIAMASVVINISNYPYFITIALILAKGDLNQSQKLVTILIATLVCSSTFIAVTIVVFAWRSRVEKWLNKGRERVIRSSGSAVPTGLMTTGVVLIVLGAIKLL